jgi:hypothetical protein
MSFVLTGSRDEVKELRLVLDRGWQSKVNVTAFPFPDPCPCQHTRALPFLSYGVEVCTCC